MPGAPLREDSKSTLSLCQSQWMLNRYRFMLLASSLAVQKRHSLSKPMLFGGGYDHVAWVGGRRGGFHGLTLQHKESAVRWFEKFPRYLREQP
jgi:hypothetical protein